MNALAVLPQAGENANAVAGGQSDAGAVVVVGHLGGRSADFLANAGSRLLAAIGCRGS